MTTLEDLQPRTKGLVIDLVQAAGVDVSDWSNGKKGAEGAKTNPKYCYEWSFLQPGEMIVLNLWHVVLEEEDGRIVHRGNFREDAAASAAAGRYNPLGRRALKLDRALQEAKRDGLAIRVILNAGLRRNRGDERSSEVKLRALDPELWILAHYDDATGAHVLQRGSVAQRFVDQFSLRADMEEEVERRERTGREYVRDPRVRLDALSRAVGRCEYCGALGFLRMDGTVYLETHHVIPLFEGGLDRLSNVICLCPNDHREAHFGARAGQLRREFLTLLSVPEAQNRAGGG